MPEQTLIVHGKETNLWEFSDHTYLIQKNEGRLWSYPILTETEEIETEESVEMVQGEDESMCCDPWHTVVYSLIKKSHKLLQGLEVGVVELQYHAPNLLKLEEIAQGSLLGDSLKLRPFLVSSKTKILILKNFTGQPMPRLHS